MQSNLTLDRMAVAEAVEHLLKEREEGWLEAAQLVVEFARANIEHNSDEGIAVGHYMLTRADGYVKRLVAFNHYRQHAMNTGAVLYDLKTLKPHTLVRIDVWLWPSLRNRFRAAVQNFLISPLLITQRAVGLERWSFMAGPRRVTLWTVIFSTKKRLKPGLVTTWPWLLY